MGSKPRQAVTGSRGYFANPGSVRWRSQSENTEPRVVWISRWCAHRLQSPAGGAGTVAVSPQRPPAGPPVVVD